MPDRPIVENLLRVAVVMSMLAAPALAQTAHTFPCPCMNNGQCLRIAGTTRTMCYCNQVRIRGAPSGSRGGASRVNRPLPRLAVRGQADPYVSSRSRLLAAMYGRLPDL